jgi:hypothetical protein
MAGEISSGGGNQLGASASNCPSLAAVDQRQSSDAVLALSWGAYGGAFKVLGWPATALPPQRNFGLGYCGATDVRGFPRADGLCDAGAFEAQP